MLASIIAQYKFVFISNYIRSTLSPLNINQKTKQCYMLNDNVICYNFMYVASISALVLIFSLQISIVRRL